MSRIRANTIVDSAATGAPTFTNGANVNNNLTVGTGVTINSPSDDEFRILTNGSERVRVDSNGRIGLGTDNPERILSIEANNPMIQIKGTGGSGKQWSILSSDDTTGAAAADRGGNFVIYDDTSGGLGDVLTLTGIGGSMGLGVQNPGAKLHVSGGNIKVDSGFGIDFSSTAGPDLNGSSENEILDDYERGSFTPKYITTDGGDSGIVHLVQNGTYVKIGTMVYVQLQVATSDWTTGVDGDIYIDNLPYAMAEGTNSAGAFNISFRREFASDVGENLLARFVRNTTLGRVVVYIYKHSTTSASNVYLAHTDFMDGSSENYIYGSGWYLTES